MFELLRKDIKIGDTIKLYLVTGKEPEGTVIEIGENFVLLQSRDSTVNRFLDKLIGGWEIIKKNQKDETVATYRLFKVARELDVDVAQVVEKLKSIGVQVEGIPSSKISEVEYEFLKKQFPVSNDILPSPELDAFLTEMIANEDKTNPLADSQLCRAYIS